MEEGRIFDLRDADRVEQMAIGGDVDRLRIRERRQHHLHLGRLKHLAIVLHVAIVHLNIRLGEEAENLGEQVALRLRSAAAPPIASHRPPAAPRPAANAAAAGVCHASIGPGIGERLVGGFGV